MKSKPISPAMHGILDYVIGSLLIAAPRLLKQDNEAVKNYQKVGKGILAINALTDAPSGIRKTIPLKAHQANDAMVLAGLATSTFSETVREDKKILGFHVALMALLATQYLLTDYNNKS